MPSRPVSAPTIRPCKPRPSPRRRTICPIPQFGSINNMSNTGHSTFHAGTVQFQKRFAQGLTLNSFYTFSKAIDDCDTDYGTCTGVEPVHRPQSQ